MWENFRIWYKQYEREITWFLIGFLTSAGIQSFTSGEYFNAFVLWAIAFLNYKVRPL